MGVVNTNKVACPHTSFFNAFGPTDLAFRIFKYVFVVLLCAIVFGLDAGCSQQYETTRLLKDLESSDKDTRMFAMHDLGEIGCVEAIDPLVELIINSPFETEKAHVADALVRIGRREVTDALVPRIRDGNGLWRFRATPIIGRIAGSTGDSGYRKELVDVLAEFSESQDAELRCSSIIALRSCSCRGAFNVLVKALAWPDEETRVMAVQSLAEQRDDRVWAILVALMNDRQPEVRVNATRKLYWADGNKNAELPLIMALSSSEASLREASAFSLGGIRSEQAVPELVRLLKDSESDVRSQAAQSLGQMGVSSAVSALAQCLEVEQDETTKYVLVYALGEIGTEDALAVLEMVAKNDSGELGDKARQYLQKKE